MRIMLVVLLAAALIATPCAGGTSANIIFENMDQCRSALATGSYTAYEPHAKWRGGKRNGDKADLEAPACADMAIVGGRHVVVLKKGTTLLWQGDQVVAHAKCKNPIYALAFAPTPTSTQPAEAPIQTVEAPLAQPQPTPKSVVVNIHHNYPYPRPDLEREENDKVGNWYTRSWKNHPVVTFLGHVAVAGLIKLASGGGGGEHNKVYGDGGTL